MDSLNEPMFSPNYITTHCEFLNDTAADEDI